MPKISVVIPTYNRAAFLNAAITSVLAQCGADFEIIISDNCSEDDTKAVVDKYLADGRVQYFKNEQNIGMVSNWRKAVYEHATSDWFVLLSDDDYLIDTNYLVKVSRLIEGNPSLVMVYAEGYLLDENTGNQTLNVLPFKGVVSGVEVFISRGTIKPQDFTLCNVVFNRRMTIELNAFSNPNNLSCDSELFLKLALMGDVAVVAGPVSVYRFHSGNLIKAVSKSPDLTYGNMDYLVAPYIFAKERIGSQQLEIFKKNTKIDSYVASCLLVVACYSWSKYLKFSHETLSKVPELIETIIHSPVYRIKLLFCRFGGWGFPFYLLIRGMWARHQSNKEIHFECKR